LALNVVAVANPDPLVASVSVVPLVWAKVPLAPDPGAENVIDTFGTGLPKPSTTVACNLVPKAVLTVADCGVPAAAETDVAEPGAFVKEKLAGVATPLVDAVTV
jgi:hypothetical protein